MTDALIYLLDNIYISFGSKLYRKNVVIPMGTNCAPFVADLFLFCYERDFTPKNQRTNGPVNAHLISGPSVSTKTSFANLKSVKVNSGSSFI